MLDEHPDLVVAFPGGAGAKNMIEIARKARVKVIVMGQGNLGTADQQRTEREDMTTVLRSFYETLDYFSTETHEAMCSDFLRALMATRKPTLANWFAEAVEARRTFDNRDQPFLNEESLRERKPLSSDARGDNRIVYLLSVRGAIGLVGVGEDYTFQYVERQVPPLRVEGSGKPKSGAGGLDYIARRAGAPILGEVKLNADQNPFYAVVQLLTYLSEMATPNQIERANRWNLYEVDIGARPAFDLHILLADFNDRGDKGKLIEPTRRLATEFKRRLRADFPGLAGTVGRVICLKMDSQSFENGGQVEVHWAV